MAIEGQGTVIEISNEDSKDTPYASATFVAIGEPTDFQGPGGSASVIDTTNLSSTRREKLMGVPDEGQFSVNGNRLPSDAGQVAAKAARAARESRWIVVTYSDDSVEYFEGYVLEFSSAGATDDKVSFSMTIEIDGEVL